MCCLLQLVLVSAGFDAAAGDKHMGGCHVTPAGYAHMTTALMSLCSAAAHANAESLLPLTPGGLISPHRGRGNSGVNWQDTGSAHALQFCCSSSRVVLALEGGYALNSLKKCVAACCKVRVYTQPCLKHLKFICVSTCSTDVADRFSYTASRMAYTEGLSS